MHPYSYVIAAACFGIQALGIGTYFAFGVFFSPLMSEFGWSRSVISGASSAAFLLMGLLGIFVGRLNDRIGPRRIMTMTGLLFGLGIILMSHLREIWQLYLFYGLIVGIGLSSIDIIALSTIARWFSGKRGLMTGIVKVGTGVGQLTIPLGASVLITNYGWRYAFLIIGVTLGIAFVVLAQLLRRDSNSLDSTSGLHLEAPADRSIANASGKIFREIIQTSQFRIVCLVNLAAAYCFLTVIVHIVPHVQDMGISPTKAAGILATIGGVSMAARLVIGIFIDRIGSKWSMGFGNCLLIVALLWLQAADNSRLLYLFAVIYGLAHGSFFTTISPLVAELFGTRTHGLLFGIVAFCATAGGALGPIMAGYVFDHTGSYNLAFWICALMSILSLVLLLFLRPIENSGEFEYRADG